MRRMNLAKRAAYSTVEIVFTDSTYAYWDTMDNPNFRKSIEEQTFPSLENIRLCPPPQPALVIDEMALRRSVIFNEGRLKHEEKLFLDMVKSGDILNLRQLTQNHPDLNVNCLDFRGRGALEIAVRCRDPHMVQELLGHPKIETELVYKAVLVAIEENMIDEVSTLLDSPAALRAAAERPSEYPNILVDNMCPIVQAALLDRLDITKLLLDKGHHIEKPHPRQCKCELRCANADYHEELSESQVELNSLRGLASPTYLVLTSPDPILTAFYMSRDLKTEAIERPEFREELLQLSQQCEHFAAELLDQCQTSEEVQTVLSQTQGFPDSRPFRFPRLYLAILLQQKQFVARPNCQQVLHTLWMSGIPQWYSWSFYRRFFHIFTQVLFTPLLCLTFLIYPRAKLLHVFRVPMNKFIHHLTLYLIFLSLILITLFYGRRDQFRFRALWSEVLVGIFVVGYVWELMLSMYTLGFRIFMRSLWSVYQLVMFFLFLVAEILYLVVFATSRTIRDNLQRELWPWYHPYLIGEALYAIATVMAFCRLLQLCQLSKIIGPLSISLNRMTGDIFRFMIILLIVFVAFCAGLNSVYKNYNGNVLRIRGIRNVTQPAAFVRKMRIRSGCLLGHLNGSSTLIIIRLFQHLSIFCHRPTVSIRHTKLGCHSGKRNGDEHVNSALLSGLVFLILSRLESFKSGTNIIIKVLSSFLFDVISSYVSSKNGITHYQEFCHHFFRRRIIRPPHPAHLGARATITIRITIDVIHLELVNRLN
ncbi:transient-receptor-potential-like protein isoform X3 [Varroa destructor]|uniref:Transient receptor ion channel domain-containing protein n=1 Tax=Varroa destructor TaxID=109461 RepID=A0A7M7M805_VARDE|nr:transient-receptor-potential-like protein isoform X3 [Varroa destructor]